MFGPYQGHVLAISAIFLLLDACDCLNFHSLYSSSLGNIFQPCGRFFPKDKTKIWTGSSLTRVMSLSDKEVKMLSNNKKKFPSFQQVYCTLLYSWIYLNVQPTDYKQSKIQIKNNIHQSWINFAGVSLKFVLLIQANHRRRSSCRYFLIICMSFCV